MTAQPDPNTEWNWIDEVLELVYNNTRQQIRDYKEHIAPYPKIAFMSEAKAQIQKRLAEVEVTARIDELESIARVYNSLPELHVARENTCIALFARIRQLTQQRDSGGKK
jgi:hypothetical protein